MASGINGPGGPTTASPLHNPASIADRTVNEPVKFQVSFDPDTAYTPASISRSLQDIPVVTVSESMDTHLSFSNLMLRQNAELEPPKAERRSSLIPTPSTRAPSKSYHRKGSFIIEEIDKIFDDGSSQTYVEPANMQIDFADPDITSEVATYPDQRFTDLDYSSHRRTQTHHSKPLSPHLSSQELKSLKSRTGLTTEKEKASRRRHRSSSSSSSQGGGSKTGGSSDLLPTQRKVKRKEKKKKKGVRKSLTAPLRQRTLSIPEEEEGDEDFIKGLEGSLHEENETEEEEEEEEEEDDGTEDRKDEEKHPDDDDTGGDSTSGADSKEQDHESSQTDRNVPKPDNKSGDYVNGANEKKKFAQALLSEEQPEDTALLKTPVSILSSKTSPEGRRKSKSASFQLGGYGDDVSPTRSEDEKKKRNSKKHRKKHHHHHHHHHKRSSITQRTASGIRLKELDEQKENERRQKHLSGDSDLEAQSHRYEVHPGIRKHLLHRPVKKRRAKVETSKILTDRKPHEVFVELDELVSGEWKETARWIKFEEDVEESQKWSKPRVASLSFHSLLELRRSIEKGAVILDLENDNLTDIANTVVEQMVMSDQIRDEDRGSVLRVLLSKHKHLPGEKGLSYTLSQASFSNLFSPSSTNLNKDEDTAVRFSHPSNETKLPLLDEPSQSDVEAGRTPTMTRAASAAARELKIMKKIPEDAEASAVLVGSLEYLEQPTLAFVRLAAGVDLENVVALPIPVRFLFVLLGPTRDDFDYHEIGRSISTLMADEEFHVAAYQADSRGDLLRAINEFLDDSIVLPPGQMENPELLRNINLYQEHLAQRKKKQLKAIEEKKEEVAPSENPLQRTKKCFGGLIRDVKRRYPKYVSDITDAFNTQCLAAFIFIYFAALSPAITFGGLLGEKTSGLMGVSEMVLSCCFCGCTMALCSGQPLLIVGATGPLLVFEEAVYAFCLSNGLPFLATRLWIGMWICIISIITVAFEGSFLIRYVTRFTQEIFAVLIALIFIFETFKKLIKTYQQHPLMSSYCVDGNLTDFNSTGFNGSDPNQLLANITQLEEDPTMYQPNTALLSTILMFGTYMIAMQLRSFKNSKFLRSSVRRTIGDFGVPIAIFIMVLLDYMLKETYTQKLDIPDGFSPTNPSARGWLINPLGTDTEPMPVWMIFAASIPAFLVFILIFMESHITELIISSKDRCLRKGTGFHLNTVVLGIVNAFVSVFGLPWVCAATIRSVTHTNSLTVMSQTHAPGERPKIVATHEQRVTCFAVNAVLGLSILMGPLLRNIPIAVLFGIFLYMGVGSLNGVQLVDRMKLLFMPAKHYPDYEYVRIVRPIKIHVFTIVEICCLTVLWVVKSTAASIAFPFFLLMTVPVRKFLLPKFFSKKELLELDNDGSSTLDKDDFEDDHNTPD